MCGRFALATPVHELAAALEAEPLSDLTPFKPSWNVAPQMHVPVVTQVGIEGQDDVPRHVRLMRWGFRPSWAKASNREPINARSETMLEKPMFRAAAQRRRGVLPADGWYEWQRVGYGKQPWYHHRHGRAISMAGMYQPGHGCVIVTCTASAPMAQIHHRQPLLLGDDQVQLWLEDRTVDAALPQPEIFFHPVSTRVGDAREDDQALVAPVSLEAEKPGQTGDLFS